MVPQGLIPHDVLMWGNSRDSGIVADLLALSATGTPLLLGTAGNCSLVTPVLGPVRIAVVVW